MAMPSDWNRWEVSCNGGDSSPYLLEKSAPQGPCPKVSENQIYQIKFDKRLEFLRDQRDIYLPDFQHFEVSMTS